MKRALFVIIAVLVASPLWSQVNGSIEMETHLQSGDAYLQGEFWLQGNITDKIGFFGWALEAKAWSEIYAGPSWKPASWLQVGAGAGVEHSTQKARFAQFVWMGDGPFYLFALAEEGGGYGFWYRAFAMYVVNKRLQLGMMSQHKLGIGPKIEVALFKPFSVWFTVMTFGSAPKTSVFGTIKLGF